MPVYVCELCETAFRNFFGFSGHWRAKHPDEERPTKTEVEREEAPEGYTGSLSVKEKELKELDELPSDPPELFYTILRLKGIPEEKAEKLKREFKVSKWLWGDAQEIAGLLKGAKLGVTSDWIRSFLKQYGSAVEYPQEKGVEFLGEKRPREEFLGTFLGSESRDPMDRYIKYQMWKEGKEEKPSPRVEEKIRALEESITGVLKQQEEVLDYLKKKEEEEEERRKEDKFEARFTKLEETIEKKGSTGGDLWQTIAEEREKRFQDREEMLAESSKNREERLIKLVEETQERMERAVKEQRLFEEKLKLERIEAIEEERDRKKKYTDEMKESGWTTREKGIEERTLDIVEHQMAPGVIEEVRAGRKLLEKVIEGPRAGVPKTPIGPEEAEKIARIMEIENTLKGA